MLHSSKAGIARQAADVRGALKALSRSTGAFDARRYFRGPVDLAFYNVGTMRMRELARSVYRTHRGDWSIDHAMAFADLLIRDRHLEAKCVGIEVVARYRRDFTPPLLNVWKRWLAKDYSANWATTDALCGILIGPLLVMFPELAPQMRVWSSDRNMWVRRASAVGLIALARKGEALDVLYGVAKRLHKDREDLIQKAVGWMLREAGKSDERRLEKYLRANGPSIPRTTVRYAIERFPEAKRRTLLAVTKGTNG
jgi:3-methyladenine DNA glycosylase AlkD